MQLCATYLAKQVGRVIHSFPVYYRVQRVWGTLFPPIYVVGGKRVCHCDRVSECDRRTETTHGHTYSVTRVISLCIVALTGLTVQVLCLITTHHVDCPHQ